MKIVWTYNAELQLDKTANYILDVYGAASRIKFLNNVLYTVQLLETQPYIGIIEPLLKDRKSSYRSIPADKINRIVYRIIDNSVEISDIWDMRRCPDSLADRIN